MSTSPASNVVASATSGESDASASLPVNLTQLMSKEDIIPDIIDGIGSVELQVSFECGLNLSNVFSFPYTGYIP